MNSKQDTLSPVHHLSNEEAQKAEEQRIVSSVQDTAEASVSTINKAIIAVEEEIKHVASTVSHFIQDTLDTNTTDDKMIEG